jgi:PAS domain S-box-containing protein
MKAKKRLSVSKKERIRGRSSKTIRGRNPKAEARRRRAQGKGNLPAGAEPQRPDLAAEAAAETERRRFLQVLDTLPVYLVLISPDHRVPFANRFFRERFGESRGRRCFEYLFRRSEPCENCESFRPFETKTLHRREWRGPDGRDYEIYDFPFTDTDGTPLIMETGIDITERRQAEAALTRVNAALEQRITERTAELAKSEQQWATMLASIGDAVVAADRGGRITFLNPIAEKLTGWDFRDAAGKPVREVFHVVDEFSRKRLEDPVAKVLAQGAIVGSADRTLLVRRDGTEIAVDESGAPIHGPQGDISGVVLIFRDVTAQRAAEGEIRGLAKFPGENPNPVLRVDRAGAILYANESSRRMLGPGLAEKGRSLPPEWLALTERAMAAGRSEAAELPIEKRTWLVTAAPVSGEEYANLYVVDITERREKENELARLNRTLKAISESNQAMMRARDEQGFMDEVCRIIVESCGYAMVWIGLAERDEGQTVRPAAYSGFEEGYLETLHITWADSERGRGPTGTAIRTGKVSLCRNMRTDPAFAPWRDEALKRGYASSIALPLMGEERAFGALMIYFREPDPFSAEELDLLAELASDLAYGIQFIRTKAARDELLARVEEQRSLAQQLADELGAIFTSISEAVLVYDSGGRIRRANSAALRMLGFDPAQMSTAEIAARLNTRQIDGQPLDPAHSPTARALNGAPVAGERYLLTGAGGRELTVMASASPLFEVGHLSGAVTVMHDVTQQEKAVSELERRAAELDAVINSIRDGIMIHDTSGRLIRMNPAAERIMDFGPEEWKLSSRDRIAKVERIEPPDGRPAADPEILPVSRALRGETVQGEELGLRQLRTGKFFWLSVTAGPLRTADGSIFGVVSMLSDITERMETENRLEKNRDELEAQVRERKREVEQANSYNRSLIEATIDPMVTIFADGKIGDVNAAAEAVTGCSRAELIGKDFSDYFTDPEKARAGYRRAFDEGKASDYELEIRHKDGRTTPVLYNASVYTDEGKTVRGIITVARDITRRRQAEALVRENTRRIEVMAEISHLLAEAGPNYEPVLPKIAKATAQLIGEECWIHLPTGDGRLHPTVRRKAEGGDSKPRAAEAFDIPGALVERVFQTKQPFFLPSVSRENILRSGTPEDIPLLEGSPLSALMIVPVLSQDRPLGVFTLARYAAGNPYTQADLDLLTTVTDRVGLMITNSNLFLDLKQALAEEQKARRQLVQTEKLAAMGRMLASVAHELNNPLQTIKNCLYLVQQEIPANPSIRDYVEMATSETSRLVNLVAQLRELYRPRAEAKMHSHDLGDILREVQALLKPQLEGGKVEWRQPDSPEDRTVSCDKERIQQVFINLATNAIEAMQPSGGTLTVSLTASENPRRLGVVFRDTGPGISPELLNNLFDPFVTTKSSGLGLGLPICYEIAQKHGGTISVENSAGGGAEFTLWLPREGTH